MIAAGGTGGHIFPVLAVWDAIRKQHSEVSLIWVGSNHRIESTLIPSKNITFHGLKQTEFRRRLTFPNFLFNLRSAFYLIASVFDSYGIIKKEKPKFIITTGGFAGGPSGIAALLTRTPLVVIEPNVYPGLTNRVLGKFANRIFVAFPEAKDYFPSNRTIVAGIPARSEIIERNRENARASLMLDDDTLFILALGGSQGAASINKYLPDAVCLILKQRPDIRFRVAHQAGKQKSEAVIEKTVEMKPDLYQIYEFIEDMPTFLAAADIVVTRAGASTLSELAARNLPAVLIPYPHSSENHQLKNARAWEDAGAAICLEEGELSASSLASALLLLLTDSSRRISMGELASKFGDPLAADRIADAIEVFLKD